MHAAHCQKYFFFFTFVKLSHCKNYNQTTTTLNKMTVLYNHTNCCNLQALLVLLLVLPLTRNISNRQSLGSWNLLKSFFFHFLNHNNIHHFINSFGDFDDNEKKKNILKLHSLSSSPTSWYIEQINLLSLMHVMYETIFFYFVLLLLWF